MNSQRKILCYLALILFFFAINAIDLVAQCGCITDTRRALARNDAKAVYRHFNTTLHKDYSFSDGSYAGPTVFDLSKSEIRRIYKAINTLPSKSLRQMKHRYKAGIARLKTNRTITSSTYDYEKADLIFQLDRTIRVTNEPLQQAKIYAKIYQANKNTSLTFTVENRFSHYKVYKGSGEKIYEGKYVSELYDAVKKRLSGQQAVYLDMKNFSKDKAKLFKTSLKLQSKKQNSKVAIHAISRKGNSTTTRDTLLMPHKITLKTRRAPKIERIKGGEYNGWFKTPVKFLLKVGGAAKQVSITIISKSRDVVMKFYNKLQSRFSSRDYTGSLADIVNEVRREIIRETRKDIIIKFVDQFGNIHFVRIRHLPAFDNKKEILSKLA
jgi:hypothetical protein